MSSKLWYLSLSLCYVIGLLFKNQRERKLPLERRSGVATQLQRLQRQHTVSITHYAVQTE